MASRARVTGRGAVLGGRPALKPDLPTSEPGSAPEQLWVLGDLFTTCESQASHLWCVAVRIKGSGA